MTFFPILERELKVRARSRVTYWTRTAIALVGALICLPQMASSSLFVTPAALGKGIFEGIIVAGFILSCFACLLTADSISAERQDGTLGLLLLTRAKIFDVLLGKLGSIGLTCLCALVAFLPLLMVPVLVGGVTGDEAFRKGLVLLDTVFFSLAAGCYASAAEEKLGRAARQALAIVGPIVLVPLVGWVFTSQLRFTGWVSPITALLCGNDFAYKHGAALSFWCSLLSLHVLAWVLLLAAAFHLRRCVQERPTRVSAKLAPWNIPASPRHGWKALAEKMSPVEWLVERQGGIRGSVWGAALLAHLNQTAIPLLGRFGRVALGFYVPSLVLHLLSGSLIAWAASRFFIDARRTGQLELLLTTPSGANEMVSGQWKALRRLLFWPVLVMLSPIFFRAIILATHAVATPLGFNLAYDPFLLLLYVGSVVFSVGAQCWLGLLFGFRAHSQAGAIARSVALAVGVPFLISVLLFVPLPGRLFGFGRYSPVVLFVAPAANIGCFLWMIRGAKLRLCRDLLGAQPKATSPKEYFSDAARQMGTTLQRARHWTPE